MAHELEKRPGILSKKMDSNRTTINPAIIDFITNDDVSVRQAILTDSTLRMEQMMLDRQANGNIQSWDVTVTDEQQEIYINFPARSLFVVNDGSNDIYVWINHNILPSHTVKSSETFQMDFEGHVLKRIYLECGSGNTSSVRVSASG